MNAPAPDQQDIERGKTNAILAYCTPIGWIIAIILHSNAKSNFAAYHIRQGLGLMIIGITLGILGVMMLFIVPFLFWPIRILNLVVLAAAIMGIVNAAGGKQTGVPGVGDMFNNMFAGIK